MTAADALHRAQAATDAIEDLMFEVSDLVDAHYAINSLGVYVDPKRVEAALRGARTKIDAALKLHGDMDWLAAGEAGEDA